MKGSSVNNRTHDLIHILTEIEIEDNKQKASHIRKQILWDKANKILGEMARSDDK
jgi:hypothetical protein